MIARRMRRRSSTTARIRLQPVQPRRVATLPWLHEIFDFRNDIKPPVCKLQAVAQVAIGNPWTRSVAWSRLPKDPPFAGWQERLRRPPTRTCRIRTHGGSRALRRARAVARSLDHPTHPLHHRLTPYPSRSALELAPPQHRCQCHHCQRRPARALGVPAGRVGLPSPSSTPFPRTRRHHRTNPPTKPGADPVTTSTTRRRRPARSTSPITSRPTAPTSPPPPPAPTTILAAPPVPHLLTIDEVAGHLRTSRKAVYALIRRGTLPGVIRLPRRLLVDRAVLVGWLEQRRAVSLTTQGAQR